MRRKLTGAFACVALVSLFLAVPAVEAGSPATTTSQSTGGVLSWLASALKSAAALIGLPISSLGESGSNVLGESGSNVLGESGSNLGESGSNVSPTTGSTYLGESGSN